MSDGPGYAGGSDSDQLGPPGIPPERLKALRDAFKETMTDPAFLADAEQAKMSIVPTYGEDTARIVGDILNLPPEQATRLARPLMEQADRLHAAALRLGEYTAAVFLASGEDA